jgi:rhodanese-related sulfurtransferase
MFNFFSNAAARPAALSARDAIPQVADGSLVLIDIREFGEVAASGKAKGAIHIPTAQLRMKADPRSPECHPALKSGKPVALYCASGGRAGMAQGMMRQLGHETVHNLGGLAHWAQAGGEIVRG